MEQYPGFEQKVKKNQLSELKTKKKPRQRWIVFAVLHSNACFNERKKNNNTDKKDAIIDCARNLAKCF
jgi:hypothetical protein